jgi:hypothetical protein
MEDMYILLDVSRILWCFMWDLKNIFMAQMLSVRDMSDHLSIWFFLNNLRVLIKLQSLLEILIIFSVYGLDTFIY